MQSWMGLQSMSPSLSTKEQEQNQQGEGEATKKPASILKTPKYSSTASTSTIEQKPVTGRQSTPVVCGDIIERDPYRPIQKMDRQKRREQVSHSVVEGYEPMSSIASPNEETSSAGGGAAGNATKTNHQVKFTTTTTATTPSKEKDDSNMVILSSLEEMFEAAGENLPEDRTTITPDTKLVEADLSFSVMTQEQYGEKMTEIKREMEDERQDMYKMFLGSDNVFDGECSSAASDDDSDDDDEFLEFLMETENYESDDEEVEEAQPRAFSLVWNVLSLWLTPEAVEWMARLEGPGESSDTPAFYNNERTLQVDKSDIGASRCAGLMAMIKMYLPSSMKELKYPDDMRRIAGKFPIRAFLQQHDCVQVFLTRPLYRNAAR